MDIKPDELYIPPVGYNDFLSALKKSKTSVSGNDLK